MPTYRLCACRSENKSVINFQINSLKEFDNFTMDFNNINEFRNFLIDNDLIKTEDLNKKLYIVYKRNGKEKKIPLLYSDFKKYLDVSYLSHKIMQFAQTTEFMHSLIREYSHTVNNGISGLVYEILNYMRGLTIKDGNIKVDNKYISKVYELMEAICYKLEKNGSRIDDYKQIRNLAVFVYKYQKKLEKIEEEKKQRIAQGVQLTLEEANKYFDSKQKESNYEYEEDEFDVDEYSDDDFEDEPWTETPFENQMRELDNHGEPIFPPNSLEETRYFQYLEELDRMADQTFKRR